MGGWLCIGRLVVAAWAPKISRATKRNVEIIEIQGPDMQHSGIYVQFRYQKTVQWYVHFIGGADWVF